MAVATNAKRREAEIVNLVRRDGFVTVDALADHLQVTPQTIRRDISRLHASGQLRRIHGGAALASSVENLAYRARQILCHEEKQRIGRKAAELVPDNASLFINIGTTTEAVALALIGHRTGLRVITNNLNVANTLYQHTEFEVIVAGGIVRQRDGGIIGESTIDFMRQFKVDIGIIGISGIDAEGTLLDYDYREVRVAQEIMANSRQVWLVTDHTKFGRNAMVRLCPLSRIDRLITDRRPPDAIRSLMAESDSELIIAS